MSQLLKKSYSILNVAIISLLCSVMILFTTAINAAEKRELVFYNWTAYVSKDVIENFEKNANAK
ncbi:hypothetical protein ACLKMH_14765 [Psychromonas sp. KJ10-10]|uniref:hypothetical protein n=1 Tax=Psychromonas sp. KJ10-10 TaxID=3391823 RepID=UPI0039B5C168